MCVNEAVDVPWGRCASRLRRLLALTDYMFYNVSLSLVVGLTLPDDGVLQIRSHSAPHLRKHDAIHGCVRPCMSYAFLYLSGQLITVHRVALRSSGEHVIPPS